MTINLERPLIADSPVSVVVLAYQAEAEITTVLEPLLSELEKLKRDYEVLVVDDASSDGTAGSVEALAQRFRRVQLLRNETSHGYGTSLSRGISAAQYPLIFTFPADRSCKAGALAAMLGAIDQVDIVCGVRKPRAAEESGRWLAFFLFGLSLKDVTCPVKLYRRTVFERLPIQSKGTFAEVEILAKANFMESLMSEMDVECEPTKGSKWPKVSGDARRLFFHPRFGEPAANVSAAT